MAQAWFLIFQSAGVRGFTTEGTEEGGNSIYFSEMPLPWERTPAILKTKNQKLKTNSALAPIAAKA
jgi:hypothetical protein